VSYLSEVEHLVARAAGRRCATIGALRMVTALCAHGHAGVVGRFRGWAGPSSQHCSPIIFSFLFSFKIPEIHIHF
jgi:hypothetical protein